MTKDKIIKDIERALEPYKNDILTYSYSVCLYTNDRDVIKVSKNYFDNVPPYICSIPNNTTI
jgi:hypothetical protein